MIYFIVLWFCYFLVSECAAFQKHHDEMSDRNRYAITFDKEADYPTYYESVKLQQAVCANVVEQPSLHLTPPPDLAVSAVLWQSVHACFVIPLF